MIATMTTGQDHIQERIAAHPFLRGMSPHQLELLAECGRLTGFETDEMLFRAGDPARGFFLIESGRVAVEGTGTDGRIVVIDVVPEGGPLGWSWIFEPFICEYSARALEPTSALFIDALRLSEHRAADLTLGHELFKRMSQVMVRRLQAARRKLVEHASPEESRR